MTGSAGLVAYGVRRAKDYQSFEMRLEIEHGGDPVGALRLAKAIVAVGAGEPVTLTRAQADLLSQQFYGKTFAAMFEGLPVACADERGL